ncbi:MAG: TIGR03086 family metal-binding protein [Actinoplanes sp.]
MPTEISKLLAAAAERTVPVVQQIQDDQLVLPTPCAEFQVRDLLNHLYQVVESFQALADRQPVDFSTTPDRLTGDWRGAFAAETGKLADAWQDPATLEGVSPGMGMPQDVVAAMALMDLTVHGWDLARATGQDYEPDPAAVTVLQPVAEQLVPQGRRMGVFGDPVPAGPDSGLFERLLALSGRQA